MMQHDTAQCAPNKYPPLLAQKQHLDFHLWSFGPRAQESDLKIGFATIKYVIRKQVIGKAKI